MVSVIEGIQLTRPAAIYNPDLDVPPNLWKPDELLRFYLVRQDEEQSSEKLLSDHSTLLQNAWLTIKFWAMSMACAKVSILLFLRRIMGVSRAVRITLNVVAVGVICSAAALILYTIFSCWPISYFWDKSIEGGWCVQNYQLRTQLKLSASLGLLSDLIMLLIPMPTVWALNMGRQRKIAITIILCIGGMYVSTLNILYRYQFSPWSSACIISLVRLIQFSQFDRTHVSSNYSTQPRIVLLYLAHRKP